MDAIGVESWAHGASDLNRGGKALGWSGSGWAVFADVDGVVACHRLLHRLGFEPGPGEMSDGQGVEEES